MFNLSGKRVSACTTEIAISSHMLGMEGRAAESTSLSLSLFFF